MIFDDGELRLIYLMLENSDICSEPFARFNRQSIEYPIWAGPVHSTSK